MTTLKRGMIIDANLDPTMGSETGKTRPCVVVTNDIYNARVPVIQVVPLTSWSEKKASIVTNVEVRPTPENGLDKLSLADCLQTRPVDYGSRLVDMRGRVSPDVLRQIDRALKIVFSL
jgi:mRNA interferase MazF